MENKEETKNKKISFHKDFEKGTRLWLCLNCGYPSIFMGVPIIFCDCKKPKPKIYPIEKIEDFIIQLQEIKIKQRE